MKQRLVFFFASASEVAAPAITGERFMWEKRRKNPHR